MSDPIDELVDWQLGAMPDQDIDPLDPMTEQDGRRGYTAADIQDTRDRMLRHADAIRKTPR